ncbi:MAG: hypothetical protein SNJ29_10635 [Rikenellaceae bacterium]
MNIIELITMTCSCSEEEAQEHLDNEVRHLRELRDLEAEGLAELEHRDYEYACDNLGIEYDHIIYFMNQLTFL